MNYIKKYCHVNFDNSWKCITVKGITTGLDFKLKYLLYISPIKKYKGLSKGWAKIRRERDAKIVKQPTTNYELPTTNYELPTTNYELPTTNYELYLSMREQTIHTMKRHVA